MTVPLIHAEGLSHCYPDGTQALNGISLGIMAGESVAVIGANGAGKSTLLLHLTGCLLPNAGELRIGDTRVRKETLADVRRIVGLVFQDPDDQLFMPTVAEDVAFGPLNLDLPVEEIDRRVGEALATVKADHLGDRPPYHLSGGEKRAVAIATVLAMDPQVLVMDEPTASLDPKARRTLIALLRALRHTLIVATHDLDMALDVCRRTVVLHKGTVLADGPTEQLLTDAALLDCAGLEKPLRLQGCPICARR